MPTNEAEVPPQRLWLPLEAALLLRGDEHGPHEIEYVPASALSEVWEKAIAAVRKVGNNIASGEEYNEFHGLIVDVIMALEAARDATLSAEKESNDGAK